MENSNEKRNDTHEVCKRCGCDIDSTNSMNGLCSSCMQLEIHNEQERNAEELMELEDLLNSGVHYGNELTDEECIKVVSEAYADFGEEQLRNDKGAQGIWVIAQFLKAGIKDNSVVNKYSPDLWYIVRNELDKLIGKNTELHIAGTVEEDEKIRNGKVVASHRDVYLLEV